MDFISDIFSPELPASQYSPLTLAYLGDNVYELFVRSYLVSQGNYPGHRLHMMAQCEIRHGSQKRQTY